MFKWDGLAGQTKVQVKLIALKLCYLSVELMPSVYVSGTESTSCQPLLTEVTVGPCTLLEETVGRA